MPRERTSLGWLLLLGVYLVGMHTRLTIYSDGKVIVPMYLCLFVGVLLLFASRELLTRGILIGLSLLLGLILCDVVSTYFIDWTLQARLRGALQLFASLLVGLGFFFALKSTERIALRRLFLTFWAVLIVVGLLENYAGLRPAMQDLVANLYGGSPRYIYDAATRDLDIYGKIRPLVFTTEPSFVAISLALATFQVFAIDLAGRPLFSLGRAVAMLVISYWVEPSLIYGFAWVVVVIWFFTQMAPAYRIATILAALLVAAVVVVALLQADGGLAKTIIDHSRDGSFFGRVIAPTMAGLKVLTHYPFFGVGVGNEDAAYPAIFDVWSATGAFSRFPWYGELTAAGLLTNPFWWHWIYFGLVGGVLFIALLWLLLGSMGVDRRLLVLVSTAIFWASGFGYVDLVSWSVFYIFAFSSEAIRTEVSGSASA
jgi:hypothetical protein